MDTNTANTALTVTAPQKAKTVTPTTSKQCRIIITAALITSVLFSLCFKGTYVVAAISSLLFFNAMSFTLYLTLKKLDLLHNKKAFWLALPIFVLSVFNAYFEYSYYNIFNCIAFFVLFSVMCLKATESESSKDELGRYIALVFFDRINFFDSMPKAKHSLDPSKIKRGIVGFMFSLPVLLAITGLLISGDAAFADTIEHILLLDFDFTSIIWSLILYAGVAVYSCGFIYSRIANRSANCTVDKIDNTMAFSFLTPVNLLFLFFCATQLSYFGSGLLLPSGTTYSGYAREGFFQLLFVTFINFMIILFFSEIIQDYGKKAVKASLLILCGFTFILILSSYYRMYLYISAYGFTPLRIEVVTFLTVEVVLTAITACAIARQKPRILRHFVFWSVVSLFVLNFAGRSEVSNRLNYKYTDTDIYEIINNCDHSDIAFLAEIYNDRTDIEKENIRHTVYNVSTYGSYADMHKHWQSESIQNIVNNIIASKIN